MNATAVKTDYDVIGLRVASVDYAEAVCRILALARRGRPAMVAAANTHIAAAAHWRREFGALMSRYDLIVPDGMPLVWCLNAQGAKLEDRVYGPCLMRRVLDATPAPWRHFFFGGTPECLAALQAAIVSWGRGCCVAGVLSPPFREWTAVERASFDDQIRTANPDFVWVALGGCRQEQWIVEHAPRFTHGVFLAVGDAFELLAGRRRIASAGLQRMGLTWMYRLVQEPRRLWKRYLVYNTLFVVALLRSGIQKPANRL